MIPTLIPAAAGSLDCLLVTTPSEQLEELRRVGPDRIPGIVGVAVPGRATAPSPSKTERTTTPVKVARPSSRRRRAAQSRWDPAVRVEV